MVGKGASVALSVADSGGALEGLRWKGTGRTVEEIFGGVSVRKRLAREGLYKGVDEDSGK